MSSDLNLPYLQGLNEKQLEAVVHTDAPLLILAGAGSGKTRVIIVKIAWFIESLGIAPWNILAVTFTNKACKEMRERLLNISPDFHSTMIKTFHSFCGWLLRRYGIYIGLSNDFSIYDDDDSISLLKSLFPEIEKKILKQYFSWISRAKDYALSPDDDLSILEADEKLPAIYKRYQERLDEIGNVDFGDMILKSIKLLNEHESIREKVHQKFRVVLVDEYQDSNVAQFQLLQLLYSPTTYLCVVGDDDQSIYRFRGAEVQNILSFQDFFPGTEVIKLEQNYRSTGNIIQAASEMITRNSGRLGKTLWTENPSGSKIAIHQFLRDTNEGEFAVKWIDRKNPSGYAILYRSNAQSVVFEKLFSQMGISYKLVGSVGFFEREEIKDAIALLRFLINPKDEIAFSRIINKPARGIGASSKMKIINSSLELSGDDSGNLLFATRIFANEGNSKAAQGAALLVNAIETASLAIETSTVAAIVQTLLEKSGLWAYFEDEDKNSQTFRIENLNELIKMASEYTSGKEGLVAFLEEMKLDTSLTANDLEEGEEETPAVTLMTMHNTKGLEFDHVLVTGLEEGVFPSQRSLTSLEDIEEERRIFYVAMTRARKTLTLTSVGSRFLYGRHQTLAPSRFLREVPDSYTTKHRNGSSNPFNQKVHGAYEDDVDDELLESSPYKKGRYVYHDDYGRGCIIKNWMAKDQELVLVRFESGATNQFFTKYSRLELISED